MKPSPIPKPRLLPVLTYQQLKTVARISRIREDQYPLPFPATQVFQRRDPLPIRATRGNPSVGNEGQYSMARFVRRVDINSREVIMYANDRITPGAASKKMASKFS
ncbi:hypothetical protein O181_099291 [Austropuccinia psidii MF-1]|uniref:Uncharacterized protein n=1 Tax=Austropuccinia psidii MF-1 TaxID=1389203 RepID=A0A9Q3JD54_9BASI|nr:hypothetical protein [Austropuccinia psidii MF-1]